jgi:hypothetical protein
MPSLLPGLCQAVLSSQNTYHAFIQMRSIAMMPPDGTALALSLKKDWLARVSCALPSAYALPTPGDTVPGDTVPDL